MARSSLHSPPPPHVKQQLVNGCTANSSSASSTSSALPCKNSHQHSNSSGSNSSSATAATSSNGFLPAYYSIPPLRLQQPQQQEESTRVQLQKQRLREQHASSNRIVIPGFKTSAAFFASLRSNLRLNASPPSSPLSTPTSMRTSLSSLPPPSPLNAPADSVMGDTIPNDSSDLTAQEDPLAGVPELSSYLATSDDEQIAGLKLVADSIAQQRQAANSALIFHPVNCAVLIAILAVTGRTLVEYGWDLAFVAIFCVGIVMTGFMGCRILTQEYLNAAEVVNFKWLGDGEVWVTKFGEEVIGTCVVEWVSGESGKQKRKKAWRGVIKGWAVRMRYRGKGVGRALLEDAVREARRKGAEGVEFAEDHANSLRVLPRMYNSGFDKRDRRARELLVELWENGSPRSKKK